MPATYIIRATIEADPTGAVGEWFHCGVNDSSDRYPSADAALIAARAAYKGPDIVGKGCRVWAERAAA